MHRFIPLHCNFKLASFIVSRLSSFPICDVIPDGWKKGASVPEVLAAYTLVGALSHGSNASYTRMALCLVDSYTCEQPAWKQTAV